MNENYENLDFIEKRRSLIVAALFIFIFYLSLSLYLRKINFSVCSFTHVADVENYKIGHFSVRHPIWVPFGIIIYKIFLFFGYHGNPIIPLQIINAIFGSMAVVLFFLIIYRISKNIFISFLGAMFWGFSSCFWFYNTDIKMYAETSFFLFFLVWYALSLKNGSSFTKIVILAVLSVILIQFHIAGIYTIAAIYVWLFFLFENFKKKLLFSSIYIILAVILSCLGHLIIYQISFFEIFRSYIDYHSIMYGLGPPSWAEFNRIYFWRYSYGSLLMNFLSFGHRGTIYSQLFFKLNIFYYKYFTGFILFLVVFFFFLGRKQLFGKDLKHLTQLILLWFFLNLLGFSLVSPDNDFSYIVFAPPIIMLFTALSVFIVSLKRQSIYLIKLFTAYFLILATVFLFLSHNVIERFIPLKTDNSIMKEIFYLKEKLNPGSIIIMNEDRSLYCNQLEYYTKFKTINLNNFLCFHSYAKNPDIALRELRQEIDSILLKKKRVYLFDDTPDTIFGISSINVLRKFFQDNYELRVEYTYEIKNIQHFLIGLYLKFN